MVNPAIVGYGEEKNVYTCYRWDQFVSQLGRPIYYPLMARGHGRSGVSWLGP